MSCKECNLNFSKNSNLRAHVKRKHPDKLDILAPVRKKQSKSGISCSECNKEFSNFGNLRLHVKRQHPDKLEEIAPIKQKIYACPHCSESFQTLNQFVLHRRTHKTSNSTPKNMVKCPLCYYTTFGRDNISLHFRSSHFLEIETECLEFHTVEDFESWKTKVEEETYASFVKYSAKKKGKHTTIYYNCHRSGFFKKRGKGIRKLKTQGSNKIDGFCPARICVRIFEKKCDVQFCNSHVGHEQKQDLRHLFLSKSQRQNVATKIAAKIPFQVILDEIRDSESNCHLERIHLLTKKDIFNIQQYFNLSGSSVSHRNDAISVEAWVHEMKDSGCVLFYKPQESLCEQYPELKNEYFLLIIMTEGQKDLLTRFGEDCICVDRTHGLNGYGFELHTILVLDDYQEGYPCAFCISNRSDSTVMNIFFTCIKEDISKDIKPKVFMSDMADVYYKSWIQVMQPAEFRLFCTWHVDKAWRKNLEKVENKEKKVLWAQEPQKADRPIDLTVYLQRHDSGNFENIGRNNGGATTLGLGAGKGVGAYIGIVISRRTPGCALAATRSIVKILSKTTLRVTLMKRLRKLNRLIDKFIKYCKDDPDILEFGMYFEQYYVPRAEQWAYCFRLNCGLNTNMHIERMHRTIKHVYLNGKFVKRLDKAIGAIMKFVKDKLFERRKGKISTKLSDLRQRHITSQSLDLDSVTETDTSRMVLSASKKEMYAIEEIKTECSCKLVCDECRTCIHRYTCTCLDASIKWNMCKHIHLICKYLQQHITNEISEVPVSGDNGGDELIIESDDEKMALINAISKTTSVETRSLEEAKKKMMTELSEQMNGVTSFQQFDAIKKCLAPINSILNAVRSQEQTNDQMSCTTTTTSGIPSNKKRKLVKPSNEEAHILAAKALI